MSLIATAPIRSPIIREIACEPSLPRNFSKPEPRRILHQQIKIDIIITKNFKNKPDITRTKLILPGPASIGIARGNTARLVSEFF